jgi:AraC-like DNA-binding protein
MRRHNALCEQAERLARQGWTIERIAKRVGLDRRQVCALLREIKELNGIAPGRFQQGASDEESER